jgi:hypothetical protein
VGGDMTYTIGEVLGVSIPLDAAIEKYTEGIAEVTSNTYTLDNTTLYVNMETMVRNAINCFDKSEGDINLKETIRSRIQEDILLFKDYMLTAHDTNVIVYQPNYKNIKTTTISNLLYSTKKKKKDLFLHRECLKKVDGLEDKKIFSSFTRKDGKASCAILTHYPMDLIEYNKFKRFFLFESHTGKIKRPSQFSTKINIKKELSEYIPFIKVMLVVFGDKTIHSGLQKDIKKKVIEIAKESNWTSMTTHNRAMFSIKSKASDVHHLLMGI